jgi:hypothetical protein
MSEVSEPQKPIPQFTLRWMLGVMTGCAVVFSIVALAMRGYLWAFGISIAIGALVLLMLVCAALFFLVWIVSLIASFRAGRTRISQSPFRDAPQTPAEGGEA